MKSPLKTALAIASFGTALMTPASPASAAETSGNPIAEGWLADPEAIIFDQTYWIYPTHSARYEEQLHFDGFSSADLVKWERHPKVLDTKNIPWVKKALWAPAVIRKDGKYYIFFSANDIQNDNEFGGIGVAVADKPEGPFRDHLGKPLVDKFHHGAQPIDAFVFRDEDGSHYLFYGGWRHCNVAKLKPDFSGFEPMKPGGELFNSITPKGYVEGPFVFRKGGKYYFMWSEGGWTGPDYQVAYAVSDSLLGPWERIGTVLKQDPEIATGAGHHSVVHNPKSDKWYIIYHRRPLGETNGNHRVTCIDEMKFDADGKIVPVKMTFEGVAADPLK